MTDRPFRVGDLVRLRINQPGFETAYTQYTVGAFVTTPMGHCLVVLESKSRFTVWPILDDLTQLEPGCGYVLELYT